jgi:hypothetical protein
MSLLVVIAAKDTTMIGATLSAAKIIIHADGMNLVSLRENKWKRTF